MSAGGLHAGLQTPACADTRLWLVADALALAAWMPRTPPDALRGEQVYARYLACHAAGLRPWGRATAVCWRGAHHAAA